MLQVIAYDETMNCVSFFLISFLELLFWIKGAVGAVPGGWEAADEQKIKQMS